MSTWLSEIVISLAGNFLASEQLLNSKGGNSYTENFDFTILCFFSCDNLLENVFVSCFVCFNCVILIRSGKYDSVFGGVALILTTPDYHHIAFRIHHQ